MKTFASLALATALSLGLAGGAAAQQKPQPTPAKKTAVATAQPTQESQPGLAAEAKVKADVARATALKEVPGKVSSEKVERRAHRLLYVFTIQPKSGKARDVLIDANTGRIVHPMRKTATGKAPTGAVHDS